MTCSEKICFTSNSDNCPLAVLAPYERERSAEVVDGVIENHEAKQIGNTPFTALQETWVKEAQRAQGLELTRTEEVLVTNAVMRVALDKCASRQLIKE